MDKYKYSKPYRRVINLTTQSLETNVNVIVIELEGAASKPEP